MNGFSMAAAAAAAWTVACVLGGAAVLRRRRGRLLAEQGLALGALALFAIAPWTALLLHALSDDPSLFGAGVQVAVALLLCAAAAHSRRARRDPERRAATSTYREKSAFLMLAGLAWVFASYFAGNWNATLADALPDFIAAVVLLVALMIVGHTVIALFHAPHEDLDAAPDERDRAVHLWSVRNAHYVMAAAVWTIPLLVLLAMPALTVINAWLAVLVLSEVTYCVSLLLYYRYGAA